MEALESRIAPAAVFALDRTNDLLVFDSHAPETILSKTPISGLPAGEQLVALSGSVTTGMFAVGSSGTFYSLSYGGVAAALSLKTPPLTGDRFALALGYYGETVVSNAGQDFERQFFSSTQFISCGPLRYAAADVHAGQTPAAAAMGSTHSYGSADQMYLVDAATDALALDKQGVLSTVGPLGVDVDDAEGGMYFTALQNFAVLSVGGAVKLYTIDLQSGAATLAGAVGDGQTRIAGIWSPAVYTWTGGSGDGLWSSGKNWDAGAAPDGGTTLFFPAARAGATVNDLPEGTRFSSVQMTGAYGLSGNGLALTSSLLAAASTVDLDVRAEGNLQIDAVRLDGELEVNGHSLYLNVRQLEGAVHSAKAGGTLRLANATVMHGTVDPGITVGLPYNASLRLGGAQLGGDVTLDSGYSTPTVITGDGTLGKVKLSGNSALAPGVGSGPLAANDLARAGTLTIRGDLVGDSSSSLSMDLLAGGADRLVVTGNVNLGGARLQLASAPYLPEGTTFTLIENQGPNAIAGAAALDGKTITSGNQDFLVSVSGGDGNDLVVTAVAPPKVTLSGGGEVEAAGGPDWGLYLNYRVQLSHSTSTPQKIHVLSRDGTAASYALGGEADYWHVDQDLVIAPGQTSANFTVRVNAKDEVAADRDFFVGISAATFGEIDPAEVRSVIHYDGPKPTIRAGGEFLETSGKVTRNLEIKLDHPYSKDVTFDYATEDYSAVEGRDYRGAHGSLTIPAGETTAKVAVRILGDTTKDRDLREFRLELSNVVNAESGGTFTYAILDDDHEPIYTLRFLDNDGDIIVLHDTLGRLNFGVMRSYVGDTHALSLGKDLWGKRFEGDEITVSAIRHGNGNGWVDMGYVDAYGVNLRSLKIQGELGVLVVGSGGKETTALGKLDVRDFARNPEVGAEGFASYILGNAGTIVDGNGFGGELYITGNLETLRIRGPISGGALANSGSIHVAGNLESAIIGLEIHGGSGAGSGVVAVQGDLGSLWANNLEGGPGANSGVVYARGRIGAISLPASISGSYGAHSGVVAAGSIGLASVGSITSGSGEGSGSIFVNRDLDSLTVVGDIASGGGDHGGSIAVGGNLGKIKVKGSIAATGTNSGGIFVNGNLGTLGVTGDVTGSEWGRVTISALGRGKTDSIGRINIGGAVSNTDILAGYDYDGRALNGGARIGTVAVGKTWSSSSLIAGALAGDDRLFGTSDDAAIRSTGSVVSRIAAIRIAGGILADASSDPARRFGIVAQQIGGLTVHGQTQALTSGADDLALDESGGFRLRELP